MDGPVTNPPSTRIVQLTVNGSQVEVPDDGCSLLDALRDRLGLHSVKDGCAPQGQCGCCTVLVDGQARVACVTPLARVAGRDVTTVEGIATAPAWAEAFCATGASQCGFCTPGIIARLAGAAAGGSTPDVSKSMLAHLCRCTGWQTIAEAAEVMTGTRLAPPARVSSANTNRRAELEGRTPQRIDIDSVLGRAGFADDTAPANALVALRNDAGEWVVAETVHEARRLAARVQGRRTTVAVSWPIELPEAPAGGWARTLQTTWVEPAYLEPDATWAEPGGEWASVNANGGAFGGKRTSELGPIAQRLANEHGRPVRMLASREDVVRFGPKRPPMAVGLNPDGTGVVVVARTAEIEAAITFATPGMEVVQVDIPGPPTSTEIRGAGWAELTAMRSSLTPGPRDRATTSDGASAEAIVHDDGSIEVWVTCGQPLDPVILRSYCIGAAHQAFGWVTAEAIAVDEAGEPADLTIRSFGIVRAVDTPQIEVHVEASDGTPVNGSDAVFAAVAAAVWRRHSFSPRWPIGRTQ
jgi:xanthine dehydrogenase small subunit